MPEILARAIPGGRLELVDIQLKCAHVLRPGGLLLVVELPGDPDGVTEEQLRTLTQGSGLKFVDSLRVSRGFLATFRRSGPLVSMA